MKIKNQDVQTAPESLSQQAVPETQGQSKATEQEMQELTRTYKDSVFVTIFHDKKKLIELYNALFDTNYDENTPIEIVTIKDVLFRTLKNDVAFVMDDRFVVLVEHQSSINENMPLRDLLYISTVLKRMIDSTQLYREKKLMIPRPQFIVFLFRCRNKNVLSRYFRYSDVLKSASFCKGSSTKHRNKFKVSF